MPRKLRLEFPGAVYHVINRGNYRSWIFQHEQTKAAFETCLFEACQRGQWRLHAFTIMSNHYHLALETPRGNLVAGMQWLQSTFANRFNKMRGERGHLFQGRYKSLLVEPGGALGQVCDYIHLNAVRARLAGAEELERYRRSSYWFLLHPAARPDFLAATTALAEAGGLADTRAGRSSYRDYLIWQAAEGPAGKNAAYVNLSRGWALGSAEFKAALIDEHGVSAECRAWETSGAQEVRERRCRHALERALRGLGKSLEEAKTGRKSAPWKLAIAAWLKLNTQARTRWIAAALALGAPQALSRNLTHYRRSIQPTDLTWQRLISLSAA
jgi:putative transposase